MAYIDTSVLVAYYCPEALSPAVDANMGKGAPLVISQLVEVEFYSAMAGKLRSGELGAVSARRVLDAFRAHMDSGLFHLVPIQEPEYVFARQWLEQFSTPLRAADALHLAAAFTNNLKLLTADKNLARSAEHFKVAHHLIA